jgi:hypothetical protein
MKILLLFVLIASACISTYSQDNQTQITVSKFHKTKIKNGKVFAKDKTIRREFEAIYAKQIADYKTQFESVKKGEKLKPDCAADFVLTNRNGTILSCEQITAQRQAKFERIKAINYLKIEIGNIEVRGNEAIVFTTQSFSRTVVVSEGRNQTIVTEGTVHKEFWMKNETGWKSKGFEEIKQGKVMIDGQLYLPSPAR